jgi:hypothetical protein
MLTAEAIVETENPSRYLVQLCKHASKMGGHLRHQMTVTHTDGYPVVPVRTHALLIGDGRAL